MWLEAGALACRPAGHGVEETAALLVDHRGWLVIKASQAAL